MKLQQRILILTNCLNTLCNKQRTLERQLAILPRHIATLRRSLETAKVQQFITEHPNSINVTVRCSQPKPKPQPSYKISPQVSTLLPDALLLRFAKLPKDEQLAIIKTLT